MVVNRLNSRCLPRMLALKARVDKGDRLSSSDIVFPARVLADAGRIRLFIDRIAEYRGLDVTGQSLPEYR